MYHKPIILAISFLVLPTSTFAQKEELLQSQRLDVVKHYVTLLGQGEYKAISHLFAPNALAVSSSGKPDTPNHFYKILFTKTIKNPQATLINLFNGLQDPNMLAAYFDYSWDNIKGQHVSAKFLDLFVFQNNSSKIK